MELPRILLMLHLGGASVTALLIVMAVNGLIRGRTDTYSRAASRIATVTCYDLITGSVLSLSSPSHSLFRFCINIAVYLAIVSGVEAVLYARIIREKNSVFPLRHVIVSIGAGLMFALVAIAG